MLPRAFLDRPFAHRALHDGNRQVAENGLTAIRRAIAGNYGVEIDVQLSRDGIAMVFHDETLHRMTDGRGPVGTRTAQELTDQKLLGRDGPIPRLSDVLNLIDGQVPLLIEVKDQTGDLSPGDKVLEGAVASALDGYQGAVAVMSFNPNMVATFKSIAPDLPRGLVTSAFLPSQWAALSSERCRALRSITDYARAGAQFISHDWTDLGSPRVAELKAHGTPVLCWTVRGPGEAREALRVADQITFEGFYP